MTSIFIVTASKGEYSDHAEWNICAVHSEERAKAIMKVLDEASLYDEKFRNARYNHHEHWCLDNPEPKLLSGRTNRQKETMRLADMKKAKEDYTALRIKRNKDYETACKAFTEANYNQPAEAIALMKKFDIKPETQAGVSYSYEELKIEDGNGEE